jgi:hypothetical protein
MANIIKFKQAVEKREAPIIRDMALVPVRAAVCWGPGAPALRVLIAIGACINDGFACISFGQIAAVTGIDRRSIPSLIKELEGFGLISRECRRRPNGTWMTNRYAVNDVTVA